MTFDKNISPVDWYIGSYLARFVEFETSADSNPDDKFIAWENTVIVKATSIDDAYAKIEAIGLEHKTPYKGGLQGVQVQWEYLGVTELLPIYEELKDGAEIMWRECSPKKFKKLKRMVKSKRDLHQ